MKKLSSAGFLTPALLGVMIAFGIIATAAGTVVLNNFFIVGNNVNRQQALNIAEAGVNYYLWHLNHNGADYRDGTATNNGNGGPAPDPELGYGPFVHDYISSDGTKTGTFTLYIKPPVSGSSVVTVRSIGKISGTSINRTVDAKLGANSFANYAVLSDTALWFGKDEKANGPVHSNQGVRMDGENTDEVTAGRSTYTPSNQLGGDGTVKPGVWCHPSVTSPVNCNTRSKAAWNYPVTTIDFNQVTGSLCTMKKAAFANDNATAPYVSSPSACNQQPNNRTDAYLPRRASSYSLYRGYLVQLNSNNTYSLYQVNGENDRAATYTSALTLSTIATSIPIPSGGVIYAEDNVWVRTNGKFSGRVTISAGRLSDNNDANIVIVDDMEYNAKNGNDVIGLVAEGDVILAPYAPPASGNFTFELDASILAQNGTVGYPSVYRTDTNRCTRGWVGNDQRLNFYGSVATRQTWTWTWIYGGSCGDAVYSTSAGGYIAGIKNNTTSYDYNLLGTPPPSFPTTGGYNFLSWREVLTRP